MSSPTSIAALAAEIDSAITAPVLVIGSLPPAAHDLDLVARAPEFSTISAHLADRGFLQWRFTWANFTADGAYAVELFQADAWGLGPKRNGDELFAGAIPIPGLQHLVRPAPHVALVMIAHSMARRRGQLSRGALRRARVAASGGADAWESAEDLASRLQLSGALAMLRRRLEDTDSSDTAGWSRGRRLGEYARAVALSPPSARIPLARSAAPRRWRPLLVSLSGPDGSGKSTQVALLRETLRAVGVESKSAWVLATTKRTRLPTPVRAYSHRWRRGKDPEGELLAVSVAGAGSPPRAPDTAPPAHVRILEQVYITGVAMANAAKLWRAVWEARAERLLVADRFMVDADVKLTYWYELRRGANVDLARRIFRAISPRADVAVLLAVAPETNYKRRADEWSLTSFQDYRRLYAEAAAQLEAVVVDAERPVPDVARDVARAVWSGLP